MGSARSTGVPATTTDASSGIFTSEVYEDPGDIGPGGHGITVIKFTG